MPLLGSHCAILTPHVTIPSRHSTSLDSFLSLVTDLPADGLRLFLCPAKMLNGCALAAFRSVDKFVAAKAPNINRVQQTSTSRPQTFQYQSLRINKNP